MEHKTATRPVRTIETSIDRPSSIPSDVIHIRWRTYQQRHFVLGRIRSQSESGGPR